MGIQDHLPSMTEGSKATSHDEAAVKRTSSRAESNDVPCVYGRKRAKITLLETVCQAGDINEMLRLAGTTASG